jgi:hypothetical protein
MTGLFGDPAPEMTKGNASVAPAASFRVISGDLPKSRFKEIRCRVSRLPRIKDNKTIRVADEDAPEEYRGQQSIFLRRQGVFP